MKYTDPSGELSFKSIGNWIAKNANDVIAGVAIVVGTVLVATGVVTFGTTGILGGSLIGLGVSHFAATYEEYKKTGDWNAASKSAGLIFGVTFNTDFGYNNSNDKPSGITQNEPVVKPDTQNNDGGKNSFSNYNWENRDGYITIEEAFNTWRYGLGKKNLNADISKLDLSKVHVSDFPKGEGSTIWVNFASKKYYTDPAQATVYGNISLTLIEGNKVFVPYQDKYDFDIRGNFGSIKRDILTVWGNMYNSFGTPYYITIKGVTTIKP